MPHFDLQIIFASLFVVSCAQIFPPNGVWSEWVQTTDCTDTCGSCAFVTKVRTCLTESQGCACVGNSIKHVPCAINPCTFPRMSCCSPYKAGVYGGKIVCGPQPTDDVLPPISFASCCPTGGLWSAWSDWSNCNGVCGTCGTSIRTRACLSEAYGCACTGNAMETSACNVIGIWSDWIKQQHCNGTCGACGSMIFTRTCLTNQCACNGPKIKTEPCGFGVCKYPNQSCCTGFNAGSHQGRVQCGPLPTITPSNPISTTCSAIPPPVTSCPNRGTWSKWSARTCNDTCGLCGVRTKTRTCLSSSTGCPCKGATTKSGKRCANKLCSFPRASCCATYAKPGVVGKKLKCVLK